MTNNEHVGSENPTPVDKQTIFKEEPAEAAATLETAEKKPTSVGLEENIAAALCHFPLIGLIFFFIEKENKVVRFHALQVIMLSVVIVVASIAVGILTGAVIFHETRNAGLDNKWSFLLLNHAGVNHFINFHGNSGLQWKGFKSPSHWQICRRTFNSETIKNMKLLWDRNPVKEVLGCLS